MGQYYVHDLYLPACDWPKCKQTAAARTTYDDGHASGPGWNLCAEHEAHFFERCWCKPKMEPGQHVFYCPARPANGDRLLTWNKRGKIVVRVPTAQP